MLIALLLWFALSWPIGVVVKFDYVLANELGYMVGDLLVLVPLIVVTLYGFRREQTWAPLLVLVVVGAFAFDMAHFLVFLARSRPMDIPGLLFYVLIPVVIAVLAWLLRRHLLVLLPGDR